MIALDVEQGTDEWLDARLGVATASQFGRILTPKTRKLSAGMKSYVAENLAEWVSGQRVDGINSDAVMRGTALEPDAVNCYEFEYSVDTTTVGLVMLDDEGLVGASPDRLVGDDGLLEIKCPMLKGFMAYQVMDEPEREHISQIQGQLFVTGRKWCDLMIYNPDLPPIYRRVYPDPAWVEAFRVALDAYLKLLRTELQALRDANVRLGLER